MKTDDDIQRGFKATLELFQVMERDWEAIVDYATTLSEAFDSPRDDTDHLRQHTREAWEILGGLVSQSEVEELVAALRAAFIETQTE